MRANAGKQLVGRGLRLVPYEAYHVTKYHKWMASEQLQAETASEPLSLEEEYAMQRSWREDEGKCTFILLRTDEAQDTSQALTLQEEEVAMIGDVNLFFNDHDDPHCAEVEVMIAEMSARRKGFGLQAVLLMLHYAVEHLKATKFVVKIGEANVPSIKLFTTALPFVEESRSTFFHEITFVCDAADTNQALHDALAEYASVQPTAYIAPADAPDVLQPASDLV